MNNLQNQSHIQIEHAIPTEIIIMIANHLPLKTYIQFSQTCKSLQRTLNSTNAIGYLNNRFKFGEDTGSLLLFTYYNILYIPEALRRIILSHFLSSFKSNMSHLIKGWSLIHAIQCLDPGRFMTLLLADESKEKNGEEDTKSFPFIERRKRLLIQHQRTFAKEIIDSIIASQIQCQSEVSKSKTYQTVFQKLVQSGDLRTVENCLRSLGPPKDCSITLSDSDYNNRFPLIDQQFGLKRTAEAAECDPHISSNKDRASDNGTPIEVICRDTLYLNYNAHEMRSLTESLMEKYHVTINNATGDSVNRRINSSSVGFGSNMDANTSFGSAQSHPRQQHRHLSPRRANN